MKRRASILMLGLLAVACASAKSPEPTQAAGVMAPPLAAPALDTARIARLTNATRPDQPVQILFDWTLQDRDFKVQGKGIVRMQGPYHARLDLFAMQDVQVLRASLINDKLDLVYSGPSVPLPPVEFVWSVVGVFRAPAGATPTALTNSGDVVTLSFDAGSAHWRFRADSTTLKGAEWLGEDGARRTVELTGPYRFGRPAKAVYRDWREFRELGLNVTAVDVVEPFAPEIWNVSNR
ncbi:MAG: hypothetical protein ABIS27_09885 [Longimicrobiales bacterium]